jgi:hypothetical protein
MTIKQQDKYPNPFAHICYRPCLLSSNLCTDPLTRPGGNLGSSTLHLLLAELSASGGGLACSSEFSLLGFLLSIISLLLLLSKSDRLRASSFAGLRTDRTLLLDDYLFVRGDCRLIYP